MLSGLQKITNIFMPQEKKLFLLDAYALIFRAYYAFISNPIKNTRGFNTSTIFGFILTLDEVLRKENPSHIGVAFDPSGPTFRHKKYPPYKQNREATPEDIKLSVPWIKKILEAYKIPVVEVMGFEADDVIGTLAKKAEKQGFTVYMMTPDKDYAQLVSDNIFMYKPARSGSGAEILGVPEVQEKFGVEKPEQVIDILGLWGDSADNVPGVPGIGEKTSKKLISQYKSVENILLNTDDFKGKQKENLVNFRDQALLSKELVTIVQDIDIKFEPEEFIKQDFNKDQLKELFDELEFRTLKNRILGIQDVSAPSKGDGQASLFGDEPEENGIEKNTLKSFDSLEKNYSLLSTTEQVEKLVESIRKRAAVCFDTETTGLDPHKADLIGIAFSLKKDEGFYLPIQGDTDSSLELLEKFREVLESTEILKVGQNLKFDIRVLRKYGIKVRGKFFDTMIAHYLINPERKHNLNILSEEYLEYSPIKIEQLIGPKGKNQLNMRQIPVEKVKDYACEDADLTWQLFEIFSKEIEKNKLNKLAGEVEMPLLNVLAEMEHIGIKLDVPALDSYAVELREDLLKIEKRIYDLAGIEFNISSPKQLGEILFDRLKIIKDAKKTKTKQYSTGEEVLIRLTDKHPIVKEVLEFRSVKKLLSTYVEALPKLINEETGRIHTSFNQSLVATGRLSSNNPNLQNIPIRDARGKKIRKSFIPGNPDTFLLAADYSQIELRLMAHLSGDKAMIDAFREGQDIHSSTAAKINGIDEKDVSREMRSQAKTANFGIIYGISAFGLSQRLNISRTDAKALIEGYFKSFPGVRNYMDECIRKAREEGRVFTLLGRKRNLPDIQSRNSVVRGVAERNAINAPIQGSAADIIKIAMVKIQDRMEREELKSGMLLQVHDELVFEVYNTEAEKMRKLVKEEMENAYSLQVPLTVDMGEGKSWLEAH